MDDTDGIRTDRPPRLLPSARKYEIRLPRQLRPGEPERYRLSAARLAMTPRNPLTTLVHFWFRTRYVSALASQISGRHPHVLGLQVRPSKAAKFLTSAIGFLPAFAKSWVQTALPEWFLPDQVVLKSQKNGDRKIVEEDFDTEVRAYRHLKPLQGVLIPKFYGLLRYNGTQAMLLDYLKGIRLSDPEGATMTLEELSDLLQPCYRALHAFGVHQDDANLSNFQLVDGRLMVMDLESVVFDYTADQRAFFMTSSIELLAEHYLSMQAYYRHDRALEAA